MEKTKVNRLISFIMSVVLLTTLLPIAQVNGAVKKITCSTYGEDYTTKSIKISKSVKSIEDGSFSKMYALEKITVDKKNKYYKSEGGLLYTKKGDILVCVPMKASKIGALESTKYYLPHALDGLFSANKVYINKLISVLNERPKNIYNVTTEYAGQYTPDFEIPEEPTNKITEPYTFPGLKFNKGKNLNLNPNYVKYYSIFEDGTPYNFYNFNKNKNIQYLVIDYTDKKEKCKVSQFSVKDKNNEYHYYSDLYKICPNLKKVKTISSSKGIYSDTSNCNYFLEVKNGTLYVVVNGYRKPEKGAKKGFFGYGAHSAKFYRVINEIYDMDRHLSSIEFPDEHDAVYIPFWNPNYIIEFDYDFFNRALAYHKAL